jgi:hypothetical protein
MLSDADPAIVIAVALARRLRCGIPELVALQWPDVTDEGFFMRSQKQRADVQVPMTSALEAALVASKRSPPALPRRHLVRTALGKGFTPAGFYRLWRIQMRAHQVRGGRRFAFRDLWRRAALPPHPKSSL